MRVVSVSEMQSIERLAERDYGLTTQILMDHAGHSVAARLASVLGGDVTACKVLVLVGPGNNGGDGLVMGRYLSIWGADVSYYHWKEQRLQVGASSEPVADDLAALADILHQSTVVVDALLGTGTSRPLSESMRRLLLAVAEEKRRRPDLFILAVDLPTGLNADTGAVDEATLGTNLTVTLAYPKRGLFFFPGAEYVGDLAVGSIGLPGDLDVPKGLELLDVEMVRPVLPTRPADSNKGTFGKVMIVAGSPAYPGSAYLSATAAGRVGAGLVTMATSIEMAPIYAAKLSEATFHLLPSGSSAPEERARALLAGLHGYRAAVIGPGLGQSDATQAFLLSLLSGLRALPPEERLGLVVDADGLNNLAEIPSWWEKLPAGTVITPHPGEMTRLRGGEHVSGGGPDRLDAAVTAARDWNLTVVLKGACTLIAGAGEALAVNGISNPALATAGTGDVLSGVIGGLLAQGLTPFDAATAGVYLHSRAGHQVSLRLGDAGLLAGDLLPELPLALRGAKST
jgi:ADP-dependent NAD(P)H-hydrate dehydratase / NAD(P)H-hydrate epimerase